MILSVISPYMDKTAKSDPLFLAKVFFLAVFAGNKIEKKYHTGFHYNKDPEALESHERGHEAQKGTCGAPPLLGTAPMLFWL
jgi:hypothetical protein